MAKLKITYEVVTADWIKIDPDGELGFVLEEQKRMKEMYEKYSEDFNIKN